MAHDVVNLDWLLRTADKFCSQEGVPRDGAVVLRDWKVASFDQIASEHDERLEAARRELSPWRKLLGALGMGPGGMGRRRPRRP